MKLYNSQIQRTVEVADHIGAKMLKYNHVKNGGIYCGISEIHIYFDTEPVQAVNPPKAEGPAQKSFHDMTKAELVSAAVERLGVTESQAKALKKDELIGALEK